MVNFEEIIKYTDSIGINIDGNNIIFDNKSTGFVEKAHEYNLKVNAYTF